MDILTDPLTQWQCAKMDVENAWLTIEEMLGDPVSWVGMDGLDAEREEALRMVRHCEAQEVKWRRIHDEEEQWKYDGARTSPDVVMISELYDKDDDWDPMPYIRQKKARFESLKAECARVDAKHGWNDIRYWGS